MFEQPCPHETSNPDVKCVRYARTHTVSAFQTTSTKSASPDGKVLKSSNNLGEAWTFDYRKDHIVIKGNILFLDRLEIIQCLHKVVEAYMVQPI